MRKAGVLVFLILIMGCSEERKTPEKEDNIEAAISQLISKMTLEKKIGQTNLRGTSSQSKDLPDDLKFVNHELIDAAEEGNYNIWIGPNAATGLKHSFYLDK
ncbi:hypothetical protein [Formosa sp. PL04]|uniref:hypothetical protein n=1 Tax=Formosa sp. PL04 TaxID=3081755 RepID=UPI002981E99D|nr:hypothetical protein [Formosa sp. PL04]MDW5287234.1 hypothetical protein [Formosa sp. PL04]